MLCLWQPEGDGTILLKVFDHSTSVTVPEQLEDRPVTGIGPYCFADRMPSFSGDIFLNDEQVTMEMLSELIDGNSLPPLVSGRSVESVFLPYTVVTLHNACFYNCRSLKSLNIGPDISNIGSDVFTNDRDLSLLVVRSRDDGRTSLQRILERISENLTVRFWDDDRVVSSLFFPEYYEWLEEVTPAHLFSRSVHGEGFRMRKAFSEGRVSYDRYDGCFFSALHEEPVSSLLTIAMNRLLYPAGLSADAEGLYKRTVEGYIDEAWRLAILNRDTTWVEYLSESFETEKGILDAMRDLAISSRWSEGAAFIMRAGMKRLKCESFELEW